MPAAPAVAPEPKWSGLSQGVPKLQVVAFIGRLVDTVPDTQSQIAQYGMRIVEKYDQVQILESPIPYPWATIDVSIKYSDHEDSAWGRHIASAKSLGLAVNAATLAAAKADLIGKVYELHRKDEAFGEGKGGEQMHGDVWRFTRIVVGGIPAGQYVPPPPATPVVPTPPAPAAPAVGFDATLLPTDTAPVRAKKLLHGRMLNEFLGVALPDPIIKNDPAFLNSIFDQSFIVGLKAQNQVVVGADGKFQVIA